MSMDGSRSEKYTSSLQSKSFKPLVLEETNFDMPVDIPNVVFDWENPPQVLQVEQLDRTHQHSVVLWAASAAATMALHHAQTDAMILNNEKFIEISPKSNYITAVEHTERGDPGGSMKCVKMRSNDQHLSHTNTHTTHNL
jgi:hypothetical protein